MRIAYHHNTIQSSTPHSLAGAILWEAVLTGGGEYPRWLEDGFQSPTGLVADLTAEEMEEAYEAVAAIRARNYEPGYTVFPGRA